jgi:hypothetical protein
MSLTALERIEALEKKAQELQAQALGAYQFAERALEGTVGTSQSLAATAKTLTALISVLSDKKTLTGEEILDGIRKIDEQNAREDVQDAVKAGTLRPIETVHQAALVVVRQIVIPTKDPVPIVLAEYRLIELPSPFTQPELREKMSGKKVGDSLTASDPQKTLTTTILEAYELVEATSAGEQPEGAKQDGKQDQGAAAQG